MAEEEQLVLPIIDSHIHLCRTQDLDGLNWWKPDLPITPNGIFLPQFKHAARSAPSLLGFVYVESGFKAHADSPDGWALPLREVALMRRVALGQPEGGEGGDEGLDPEDARLCLGLVPWAPLPSGPAVLEQYIDRVREVAGEAWPKVKGFRYLAQDQPHGTMVRKDFIEGLKLLGRRGLVFEVGVDHRRRGKKQMDELVDMIDMAHEGVPEEEKVTFVLNHLCKPDLTIYNITSDPSFHNWRTAIYTLSKCSRTYMKLSGAFSEMPPALRVETPSHIFQSTLGWLGIVLATFGPSRIMFGSDWPVCTIDEPVKEKKEKKEGDDEEEEEKEKEEPRGSDTWGRWRQVVEKMCWMATLSDEERAMIFGGTAKEAYGL
ncbi:L-rhamnono-gamma-lactonase [Amphichorda felina]